MSDLNKMFVYVPADQESTFKSNVINKSSEAKKYYNKIVFLESSKCLWLNGVYYGKRGLFGNSE